MRHSTRILTLVAALFGCFFARAVGFSPRGPATQSLVHDRARRFSPYPRRARLGNVKQPMAGFEPSPLPLSLKGRGVFTHVLGLFTALVASTLCTSPGRAADIVYPLADGTLVDGGPWGNYDGTADAWNWTFGPTGFAGAITLVTETPGSAVQQRMVFEYDLRNINRTTPLAATLTFAVRGVRLSPFHDVTLHVYSFPADLIESPSDFSAGPAVLQGIVTVAANQNSKAVALDVSGLVAAALGGGNKRVAFRFQIDPGTPYAANQVFIDAVDSQPASKPFLTIYSAVPGDADDDGDADVRDFAMLMDCLAGPAALPTPARSGITRDQCLRVFDHDADEDVDLADLSALLALFNR